jgi:hypothetical protein
MSSYAVVIPTYHAHMHRLVRLLKSMQAKVTDQDKCDIFVVTADKVEQTTLCTLINNFVPGLNVNVWNYEDVPALLNINCHPEILHNIHNRHHFTYNYLSLKKLLTTLAVQRDYVLLLDSDSYVYREMSIWDDVIKPYLDHPRHYSYIPQEQFLRDLIAGACQLLQQPADAASGYNFEHQNWIYERDLLDEFCADTASTWGVPHIYNAIHPLFFRPHENTVFFETMAYRYWLENSQRQGNARLAKYEFLDSFDALAAYIDPFNLAATGPAGYPIEHLLNWLSPKNFTGMQDFINAHQLALLRVDTNARHPWLVKQLLETTPQVKFLVCSQGYELYL